MGIETYQNMTEITDRDVLQDIMQPVKELRIDLKSGFQPLKPGAMVRGRVSFVSSIDEFQIDNIAVCLYGTCKSQIGEQVQTHVLVKRVQDCTPLVPMEKGLRPQILRGGDVWDGDFSIPLPEHSYCPCVRLHPGQETAVLPPSGFQGESKKRSVKVKYQLLVRVKGIGHPRASVKREIIVASTANPARLLNPMLNRAITIGKRTECHKIKLDKARFPSDTWSFFSPSESKVMVQAFVPSRFWAGETTGVRMFMLFSVPASTFKKPGSNTEAVFMGPTQDKRGEVRFYNCSVKMRYRLINLAHEVIDKDFVTRTLQHVDFATVNISNIVSTKELHMKSRQIFGKDVSKMNGIELGNAFPKFAVPKDMIQYASCGVATNEFSMNISGEYEIEMEEGLERHAFDIEVQPSRSLPLVDVWDEGSFSKPR